VDGTWNVVTTLTFVGAMVFNPSCSKEMAEEAGDGLVISFNKHRSISDKNSRPTMNVVRCLAFPDATIYTIHRRTRVRPDPTYIDSFRIKYLPISGASAMHPFLSRRRFVLKSVAGALAIPVLPSVADDAIGKRSVVDVAPGAGVSAGRFVAIGNLLGFQRKQLFPETQGKEFETTKLLEPLEPLRDQMTVYRGLNHGLKGGHFAVHTFLSGVLHHEAKNRPDGNVTVDQFIADVIGKQTRFASLTVGCEGGIHGGCQLAWTRSGIRVAPITGPSALFEKLFIEDSLGQKEKQKIANGLQASILDAMVDEAKALSSQINREDNAKLDQYLSSVRDVEKRLQAKSQWVDQPKPMAPMGRPADRNTVHDLPLLYEMIALALQTDSTRVATLEIGGSFLPQDLGIDKSYHGLSHHGNEENAIADLIKLERYQIEHFGKFLTRLAEINDGDRSLLDSTAVLFGSGIADANSHTNDDLPIIMAGGGYGRGEFKQMKERVPLCNLYLDIIQRLGIPAESFGTSTGTFS
jgi:hypothetical protein